MSIKDIHVEYATINYAGAMKGWALPGQTFTKSRNVAEKAAIAINKLIKNSPHFEGFNNSFKVKH